MNQLSDVHPTYIKHNLELNWTFFVLPIIFAYIFIEEIEDYDLGFLPLLIESFSIKLILNYQNKMD